jgi:D-xylose transport system substrate-binding protein
MRIRTTAVAGLAVIALALTACGGEDSGDSGDKSSEKAKVGVILPDAATSPRWENNDRPALKKAIEAAGYEAIIQNASKEVTKFTSRSDWTRRASLRRTSSKSTVTRPTTTPRCSSRATSRH